MKWNQYISMGVILFCYYVPACAFKEPDPGGVQQDSQPISQPSALPQPPEVRPPKEEPRPHYKLMVDWKRGEGDSDVQHLTRTILQPSPPYRKYTLNAPITLTEAVPDQVDITVALPTVAGDQASGDLTATARVHESGAESYETALRVTPNPVSYILKSDAAEEKVTVYGLRNLLSDSEEQKISLTLEFHFIQNGNSLGIIDFVFATPPKSVALSQETLSDYVKKMGDVSWSMREVRSESIELSLLQLIEIENKSDQGISVEFPTALHGSLSQGRRSLTPQKTWLEGLTCTDHTTVDEQDHLYAKDFYLLPFEPDVSETWTKRIVANTLSFIIPKSEKKIIGVYAMTTTPSDSLLSALSTYNPKSYVATVPPIFKEIPIQCQFGCVLPNTTPRFANQCSAIPEDQEQTRAQCQARVATCLPCIKRWFNRPNMYDHPIETGPDCNDCYKLEITEGILKIFKYNGVSACFQDWKTDVLSKRQAKRGLELDNILLNLDVSNVFAFLRYAHSNIKDDPEARKITFLNGSTVQEQ